MLCMVKIEGLDNLHKVLKAYAANTPKKTKSAIQKAGFRLQTAAKRDATVGKKHGGNLRLSIVIDPIEDDGFTAKVSAGGAIAPYAPYIEFGTGGMVEIPEGWAEIAAQFKGAGIRQVNLPARPYLSNNHEIEAKKLIEELKRIADEIR